MPALPLCHRGLLCVSIQADRLLETLGQDRHGQVGATQHRVCFFRVSPHSPRPLASRGSKESSPRQPGSSVAKDSGKPSTARPREAGLRDLSVTSLWHCESPGAGPWVYAQNPTQAQPGCFRSTLWGNVSELIDPSRFPAHPGWGVSA